MIKRFNTENKNIVFKKANGDNFAIPTKIATEMLEANIKSLKAALNNNTEELEKYYNSMAPCYSKAFIAFNLYSLYKTFALSKTS